MLGHEIFLWYWDKQEISRKVQLWHYRRGLRRADSQRLQGVPISLRFSLQISTDRYDSTAAAKSRAPKTSCGSTALAVVHVSVLIVVCDHQSNLTQPDVVTEVAGLLDKIGVFTCDESFDKTYEVASNLYKAIQKGHEKENSGKVSRM